MRQVYNPAKGAMDHEQIKWRVTGVHKSTEDGTMEMGNPLGSTEKYSVLRYEKIVNGKTEILISAQDGKIVFNGKSYTDPVENLLK